MLYKSRKTIIYVLVIVMFGVLVTGCASLTKTVRSYQGDAIISTADPRLRIETRATLLIESVKSYHQEFAHADIGVGGLIRDHKFIFVFDEQSVSKPQKYFVVQFLSTKEGFWGMHLLLWAERRLDDGYTDIAGESFQYVITRENDNYVMLTLAKIMRTGGYDPFTGKNDTSIVLIHYLLDETHVNQIKQLNPDTQLASLLLSAIKKDITLQYNFKDKSVNKGPAKIRFEEPVAEDQWLRNVEQIAESFTLNLADKGLKEVPQLFVRGF